jgi:hypothetical protein
MNCAICEKPVTDSEDHIVYSGHRSHLCCFVYHLAFEVDNTMMCFGVTVTPAFEKARKSFQEAFLKTYSTTRCEHRPDWRGWPWGAR